MSQDTKRIKGVCPTCKKKCKDINRHMEVSHSNTQELITEQTPSVQPDIAPIPPAPFIPTAPMKAVKMRRISWWRLAIGIICGIAGGYAIIQYTQTLSMVWGGVAVTALCIGGTFVFYAYMKKGDTGYKFVIPGQKEFTGKENTLVIDAFWDEKNKVAIPEQIYFKELLPEEIPVGSRMHLIRNLNKHFYEVYNLIDEEKGEVKEGNRRKYVALIPPDKIMCTPEEYSMTSNMQAVKDYFDFNPPTNFQKIAAGVLIAAMGIIGLLMTITGGAPPAAATGG
jgi:hypothetical protein